MKRLLSIGAAVCLAGAAMGQLNQVQVGVSAGVYMPTDRFIKDTFGDQIYTLGLGLVGFGRPSANKLTPNFNLIGADKNGNNFLLIPVTMGYEFHFGDNTASTVPYARLEAGASYDTYSIGSGVNKVSGSHVGFVGDAEVGVEFNKSLRVSAKYFGFQKQDGLNFNGLQLSLTFALFHL